MKTMNFDTIALSKGFIMVPNSQGVLEAVEKIDYAKVAEKLMTPGQADVAMATLIQSELMHYGKMLDKAAFLALVAMPIDRQKEIAAAVTSYFTELFGDGQYHTLFGDFPNTVLQMSEIEMLIHTILHYISDGKYIPDPMTPGDSENRRAEINECVKDKYDMITVGDAFTLALKVGVFLKSEQSLTQYDKDVLSYFCDNWKNLGLTSAQVVAAFPDEIPFKETLCIVASKLGFYPLKTATDVLRTAVFMSGGDIALPAIPKTISEGWSYRKITKADKKALGFNFKHFSRPERRVILSLLEIALSDTAASKNRFKAGLEDMKKWEGRWIRLGEILHPGTMADKYPLAAKAFDTLRNNSKSIKTWNSFVEEAKAHKEFDKLINLYKQRPGEFARALDYVLRTYPQKTTEIVNAFGASATSISIKLVYELINHFYGRDKAVTGRQVMVKGARKPTLLKDLTPLKTSAVHEVVNMLIEQLVYRFAQKDSLEGQTWFVDKALEDIPLPENMRSINAGVIQMARGTKMPLPENADIIRCYCHWVDTGGREDLDLSAQLYDENFVQKGNVYFGSCYRLSGGQLTNGGGYFSSSKAGDDTVCQFSGDVRNRRGNCAEYIDISVSRAAKAGIRYLVTQVNDYNGHRFSCDCYGGIMARSEWGTPGETAWAPSTVMNGIKIESKCQRIVLMVVDVIDRKVIFVDQDLDGIPVPAGRGGDVFKTVLERYCGKNIKFMNALKIISINLAARKADIKVDEDSEKLATAKAQHEAALETLKKRLSDKKIELADLEAGSLGKVSIPDLKEEIAVIENEVAEAEKVHFVLYEDVVKDYSNVLDWMF